MAWINLFTQIFSKKLNTEDSFVSQMKYKPIFYAAKPLNWLFFAHFEQSAFFKRLLNR